MQKAIKVAIALLILAAIVNDTSYYFLALYDLRDTTRQAASIAAASARGGQDANHAWQAAESYAKKSGATIYGYDQSKSQVTVWTRAPVSRVWLLGYMNAIFTREPLGTPFTILEEETAGVN
jgi:Flp pilus assembly protein TadG